MNEGVAVCIPTLERPEAVRRVLESIAKQQRVPDVVLVVDASADDATKQVCEQVAMPCPVRHEHAERSLTRQRRHGIASLQGIEDIGFVCMLDDDVTLEPDFLERTIGFLSSPDGAAYGGVSGYDLQRWGKSFERIDRLYARIGLYGKEGLRPGRWLYNGRFLELSHLEPLDGVHPTDFIGGGLVVWRMEVFDRFLPPVAMDGYALFEDKHLSLRVGSAYRLGVLGAAGVWHDRAPGGRPNRVTIGFQQIERIALMLRDCDPSPTVRRYLAFLGFSAIDIVVRIVLALVRLRFGDMRRQLGSIAGLLWCIVRPPRSSPDALVPARGNR